MGRRPLVKFDFALNDFVKNVRFKSDSQKAKVERDVKDLVLKEVLKKVSVGTSPVDGGRFQSLNPEYAKHKKSEGGTVLGGNGSNLELEGRMLSSLKIVKTSNGKMRLTVSDSEQSKADGHNNFSGLSPLPERKFIPNEKNGEFFTTDITKKVQSVIKSITNDKSNAKDK